MKILRNSQTEYALIAKLFHWFSAVIVFGLFALGLWMGSLDYYDPWYQKAPYWHISFGVLLLLVTLARLFYRVALQLPDPLPAPKFQIWIAKIIHWLFYLLIFAMFATGYLIVTAKGNSLDFFGIFEIPALITDVDELEDTMEELHEIMAYSIIGMAVLHALAALKHHFIDRDGTLKRMISRM